jgi:hypothetical protein
VAGARRSARSQDTLRAQGGGVGEDVTDDQVGSPERLGACISTYSHMEAIQEAEVEGFFRTGIT